MEKERFKERKTLELLISDIDRDTDAVIVEGLGDKLVLKELGYTGKIFLSAQKTLEDLLEDVERGAEKVGVLTDFDSHGKEEAEKIRHELQKKIDVMTSVREKFGSQLTSTGRRTVEEIRPLLHSNQEKFVDATLDRLYPSEKDLEIS